MSQQQDPVGPDGDRFVHTPHYRGPERRQASEMLSRDEVSRWRADTARLTEATERLTERLGDLTTKAEVDDRLDLRVQEVEADVAAIVSGTKLQSHRVRMAGWLVYAFGSLLTMLVLINLHDLQLQECVVKPITSHSQRWVCDATLPLHSHVSAGDTVVGSSAGARLVGSLGYLGLAVGLGIGISRYRRRRAEEMAVLAVDQHGRSVPQMARHADGTDSGST